MIDLEECVSIYVNSSFFDVKYEYSVEIIITIVLV